MGNFIENVPFIFSYIIKHSRNKRSWQTTRGEGEITASSHRPTFTEEFKRQKFWMEHIYYRCYLSENLEEAQSQTAGLHKAVMIFLLFRLI